MKTAAVCRRGGAASSPRAGSAPVGVRTPSPRGKGASSTGGFRVEGPVTRSQRMSRRKNARSPVTLGSFVPLSQPVAPPAARAHRSSRVTASRSYLAALSGSEAEDGDEVADRSDEASSSAESATSFSASESGAVVGARVSAETAVAAAAARVAADRVTEKGPGAAALENQADDYLSAQGTRDPDLPATLKLARDISVGDADSGPEWAKSVALAQSLEDAELALKVHCLAVVDGRPPPSTVAEGAGGSAASSPVSTKPSHPVRQAAAGARGAKVDTPAVGAVAVRSLNVFGCLITDSRQSCDQLCTARLRAKLYE
ncbi:unnamed protein product [Ectocarpus sp. CCAP 1310/34]|nr:unnamed protein product [Ectocarpus sp. CCAP 1310/34]